MSRKTVDKMKRRPIHFACYSGNIEIINLLIANGCELEIEDLMKQTPLKIAKKNNFSDLSKIIKKEIVKRKIAKIKAAMGKECVNECDHTDCYSSYLQSLLTKKFRQNERIGKGNFGKVYKCQKSCEDQIFAVKIIKENTDLTKYIENNINHFTGILNHDRIIKYFGAVERKNNMFIFMEFLSGKSLEIKNKSSIPSPKVIHYTKQLVEALKFLHERNIVHRDIKPENSVLDDEGNLKLIDFGLSLLLTNTDEIIEKAVTFCGTKDYMAPEIMKRDSYTCSVDVWSLGVLVVHMATGKIPLPKIWPSLEYQLPNSFSTDFKDLVDNMLIPDPEKRVSADSLFTKFKCIQQ